MSETRAPIPSLVGLGTKAGLCASGYMMTRIIMLQRALDLGGDKEAVHEANDRMTAADEATTGFCLRPLDHAEWLLPILGFIGTVWGFIGTVDGLRAGVNELFDRMALSKEVLDYFMESFKGLVLAFDTTLFGLLGMAIVGSLRWSLSHEAERAILQADKWCGEAVNLCESGGLAKAFRQFANLVKRALFEMDRQGRVLADKNGAPLLRLQRWLETALVMRRDGQIVADADGAPRLRIQDSLERMFLELDEQGRPVPDEATGQPALRGRREILEALRLLTQGFLETDPEGHPLAGEDGRPRLRWQGWMDTVLAGLLVVDAEGRVARQEGTGAPINPTHVYLTEIAQILVRDVFEVTEEEAEAVATGLLAGSGEEVPLRLRDERRHTQTRSALVVVYTLMQEVLDALQRITGPGTDPPPPRVSGIQVLEPKGSPVDAIALTNTRFAVARRDPDDPDAYRLWTGDLGSQFGGRIVVPTVTGDDMTTAQRVGALAGLDESLAYGLSGTGTFYVRKWRGGADMVYHSVPSDIHRNGLGMLELNNMRQVVIAAQQDHAASLYAWPVDGSAPDPVEVKKLRGELRAVAARPGEALACAVQNPKGAAIIRLRSNQEPETLPAPQGVTALAFAPDGSVWCATEDGALGALGDSEQRRRTGLKLPAEEAPIDQMAVTATGQLILAPREASKLIVVYPAGEAPLTELTYPCPVSALAATPDGRMTFIGLADGSAFCLDTRRVLRAADRDPGQPQASCPTGGRP